jgi:hypothetical protein
MIFKSLGQQVEPFHQDDEAGGEGRRKPARCWRTKRRPAVDGPRLQGRTSLNARIIGEPEPLKRRNALNTTPKLQAGLFGASRLTPSGPP